MRFCLVLKSKSFFTAAVCFIFVAAVAVSAVDHHRSGKGAVAASAEVKAVPILMYHSILQDESRAGDYVLSPEVFRQDMEYLKARGYTSVFVSELTEYVNGNADLPEKPVVITLDDGYLNNLTYVLPILEELDMKAVISVIGAYSEEFAQNGDRNVMYAHVTWEDIKALCESGHVEIGNHTYDMHKLEPRKGCAKNVDETLAEYRTSLTEDVSQLQTALAEKSGITPTVFTYPYGLFSDETLPIIKELGFSAALNCTEKINYLTRDPEQLYHLGRFNRPAGISTEEFMKKTGIF